MLVNKIKHNSKYFIWHIHSKQTVMYSPFDWLLRVFQNRLHYFIECGWLFEFFYSSHLCCAPQTTSPISKFSIRQNCSGTLPLARSTSYVFNFIYFQVDLENIAKDNSASIDRLKQNDVGTATTNQVNKHIICPSSIWL